jgi:hypothetical protein
MEAALKKWNELVEELDLDIYEQRILTEDITTRRKNRLAEMRSNDYLGNMSGGLFGSMFKKAKKEIDGDKK